MSSNQNRHWRNQFSLMEYSLLITGLVLKYLDTILGRAATDAQDLLKLKHCSSGEYILSVDWVCFKIRETGTFEFYSCVTIPHYAGAATDERKLTNTWTLLTRERLLAAGVEIKSLHDARAVFKAIRSTINHIEKKPAHGFQRPTRFYSKLTKIQ